MSHDGNPDIPVVPEVDQHGGDELPTYEDLATQHGPNSRCLPLVVRLSRCGADHLLNYAGLVAGEHG
jgi:hypothetical protein